MDLRNMRDHVSANGSQGNRSSSMIEQEDNRQPVVKPSNPSAVKSLQQNFLQIAKREREDSKDRDMNFYPVSQAQAKAQGLSQPDGRPESHSRPPIYQPPETAVNPAQLDTVRNADFDASNVHSAEKPANQSMVQQ